MADEELRVGDDDPRSGGCRSVVWGDDDVKLAVSDHGIRKYFADRV